MYVLYLHKSINSAGKWAKHNKIKFSTSKTVDIHFAGRKCHEVLPNLKLDGGCSIIC